MKQCIHDIYKIIDRSYFNIKDKKYNFNLNKMNNYKLPVRSMYIPETIIKWINNNIKFNYNLIINIKNREVIIDIYSDKYIDNINYYFFKIELALLILTNYSFKNCSKNINIKIYLTPFKKIWTINNPIDVFNVNTGYSTIGCINSSELLLFRQEEWYKVVEIQIILLKVFSEIIYLSHYNEKTNVFCYYILTSVLMYYSEDFILWCKKNNEFLINFKKDNNNIINFINFIIDKYYSKDYISNLEKSITNDITMRMTIIS